MRQVGIVAVGVLVAGLWGPTAAAVPDPGWSDPVAVSRAAGDVWDLDLAVHDGRGLAVWVRWTGRSSRVEAAWQRAEARSAPVRVRGTHDAAEVEVAYDARGRARLAWTEGRRVFSARLHRDGSTSGPALLHRTPASPLGTRPADLRLAVGPDGAAVVAWQTMDDDEAPPYASPAAQVVARDARGRWHGVRTLSDPGADATAPEVVVDGRGRATVAWGERWGRAWLVQTASRRAWSAWGAPRTLSAVDERADPPQLAGLPSGSLAVAWATRAGERHAVVLRRWSRAAGWSPRSVVPSGTGRSRAPSWLDLGLSRRDAVVAYAVVRRDVEARQAVRVARVSESGRVAVTRLAPRVAVFYGMHVAVDRAGDALVAWDSVRGGDHPVEAAYGDRHGGWGPVTRISATRGDAFLGAVAVHDEGDGLAVWSAGELADPDSSRVWSRSFSAR